MVVVGGGREPFRSTPPPDATKPDRGHPDRLAVTDPLPGGHGAAVGSLDSKGLSHLPPPPGPLEVCDDRGRRNICHFPSPLGPQTDPDLLHTKGVGTSTQIRFHSDRLPLFGGGGATTPWDPFGPRQTRGLLRRSPQTQKGRSASSGEG